MSKADTSGRGKLNRRSFLKRGAAVACAAGGFTAAYASYESWRRSSRLERMPTIVLITLDTTRADHLGCYGYARPTSPNIDRLAAESLVYEKAIASATWTLPSHASLFTGKFTASHGVCKAIDGELDLAVPQYGPEAVNHYRARAIAADERMLAAWLSDAGYSTAAVVAGPWMKQVFGMDRGFDLYDDENIETVNARPAEEVTDRALEWMSRPAEQPRFLFLNYFDPHFPYHPPDDFARHFTAGHDSDPLSLSTDPAALRQRVGLYDGEILYMDHHLGRLFDGLRRLDEFDDAWFIITADHGEMLGEHGVFGHPGVVYQEAVHVPLIVKQPKPLVASQTGRATGRVDDWVQLVDVFPMILEAAGIEPPDGIQGEVPPGVGHPIVIESRTLPGINDGGDWFAIIDDGWKYVWNSEGNHMLFNLDEDPREQQNLFVSYPQHARALGDSLHEYLAGLPEPGPQSSMQVDEQTRAQLKSLGYVR